MAAMDWQIRPLVNPSTYLIEKSSTFLSPRGSNRTFKGSLYGSNPPKQIFLKCGTNVAIWGKSQLSFRWTKSRYGWFKNISPVQLECSCQETAMLRASRIIQLIKANIKFIDRSYRLQGHNCRHLMLFCRTLKNHSVYNCFQLVRWILVIEPHTQVAFPRYLTQS